MKRDITPLDKHNRRHGYWEYYYNNGNPWFNGNYHHGNAHGYWESYWADGKLISKGRYHHGEKIGYWIWFNETIYYARM